MVYFHSKSFTLDVTGVFSLKYEQHKCLKVSKTRTLVGLKNGLQSFSDLQLHQSPLQTFGNLSNCCKYITVTVMFPTFFSPLESSKYSSNFSISYVFIKYSAGTVELSRWKVIFLLLFNIWLCGHDWLIRLHYKVLKNLMHLIFYLRVWFVHKAFISMINF